MSKFDRYDSLIRYYAEQNNLDWLKVKAQIRAESAFIPAVRSTVGAVGLMQFMPTTWKWAKEMGWIDEHEYATDPESSIKAGCAYMRWLLHQVKQDDRKAFAAYNWGIGNVSKVVRNHGDAWISHLPKETAGYIVRIHDYYAEYIHEQTGVKIS